MIRSIYVCSHVKNRSVFNHHTKTRLKSNTKCSSCKSGKHDCHSMNCTCVRCGFTLKKLGEQWEP